MMLVGFEPTPEDWCLKPAPLVAHRELRPLGHIINVRDSDRVRTRIDLVRIDPATLAGVDFKSTALTTRPHYHKSKPR